MKKIMFMLGVATIVCGVQAASFQWTTSDKAWGLAASDLAAGLAEGKTYNVGSANADTMSNQMSSYSATWMYTLILTDPSDSTKTQTLTGNLTTFSSRKVKENLSSDLAVAGTDLSYSIVFSGSVTDGQNKTWDVTSNTIMGSWHVNDMGDILLQTASASSWSTSGGGGGGQGDNPAPEPTSGLLLLVGGALLGLRRKRA